MRAWPALLYCGHKGCCIEAPDSVINQQTTGAQSIRPFIEEPVTPRTAFSGIDNDTHSADERGSTPAAWIRVCVARGAAARDLAHVRVRLLERFRHTHRELGHHA